MSSAYFLCKRFLRITKITAMIMAMMMAAPAAEPAIIPIILGDIPACVIPGPQNITYHHILINNVHLIENIIQE